jgi:hypothetical protein
MNFLIRSTRPLNHFNRMISYQTIEIMQQRSLYTAKNSILYSSSIPNSKPPSNDVQKKQLENVILNSQVPELNLIQKMKQKLGFGFKYNQSTLSYAAINLYLCIQYQIDYDKFFKKLDLPDVMYSYCLITFLHVWMISVVLMRTESTFDYSTGVQLRKLLVANMWKDIETRAKKLKVGMNRKNSLKTYNNLNATFYAFFFGFDEGLLNDDTVLAGAVWRHLLDMRPELKDHAVLAEMCDYIRKNINHLESIIEKDIFTQGLVSFVDFDQNEVDHFKVRVKLLEKIKKNRPQ